MSRHLIESEIEALAHDREELVAENERAHLTVCDACAESVLSTRLLSQDLAVTLREELPVPDFALDDLVSRALEHAYERAPLSQAPVPDRGALLSGVLGGLLLALTTGALSRPDVPSLSGIYEVLRVLKSVMVAIDSDVVSRLPGGWGLVMVGTWAVLAVLVLPARLLLVRRSNGTAHMLTNMLVALALMFAALPARALDIDGDLPEKPLINLSVMREPTSKVLTRIADSTGLSLVVTLPDDPLVSVRLKQATLRDCLTAVLGEQPVRVRVEGKILTVRADGNAPVARPAEPVIAQPATPAEPAPNGVGVIPPGPLPPFVTTPPAPAVPSVPPAPPRPPTPPAKLRKAKDRVVMGGSNTVAADEVVRDAIAVGGSLTIYGEVQGDAVAIGGHVHLKPGSIVHGSLMAVGGAVEKDKGAIVLGDEDYEGSTQDKLDKVEAAVDKAADKADQAAEEQEEAAAAQRENADERREEARAARDAERDAREDDDDDDDEEDGWLSQTLSSASNHALLFVLGLALIGLWPRRMQALERAISRAPAPTFALGILGAVGAAVLSVLLLLTIIGIPAGIVLGLASALAMYAGLAAAALAIGKILPIKRLEDRTVLQLAAGVFVLFLLARVPVLGPVAFIVAAGLGLGAIVRTRFAEATPDAPPPAPPPPPSTDPPASTESDLMIPTDFTP